VDKHHPHATIEVYRLPVDRPPPAMEPAIARLTDSAAVYLQQAFDALLAADERLAVWIRRMQQLRLQAVVFGGWARDRLVETMSNRECLSADIDFVSHGDRSVAAVLPDDAVVNPFGGFGVQGTCIHIDAWNLQDTFLIRRHGLPISFDQLPLTADYTVNAVIFKPSQFFRHSNVVDRGAVTAIQTGILEFAADDVAQPRVQAARAVILAARLQFVLSPTVRSFIRAICDSHDVREAVTIGIRTYCPARWRDVATSLLNNIISERS
jgi:hypothetical protein